MLRRLDIRPAGRVEWCESSTVWFGVNQQKWKSMLDMLVTAVIALSAQQAPPVDTTVATVQEDAPGVGL